MKNLALEATRGYTKKITQFIGLILFVIGAVLTFTALFSAVFQVKNALNESTHYSKTYQYEVKTSALYIDNNVNIKGTGEPINDLNRKFLEEFYDSAAIDKDVLNFNTLKSDLINLECSQLDNNLCIWTTPPSYLNRTIGTASFTTLVKNFKSNIPSTFLSYIIRNPEISGLNQKINNKNIFLDVSFSTNYQFVVENSSKNRHYFNVAAISKDTNRLYQGTSWRSNNIFNSSFNNVYDYSNHEVVTDIKTNTIYLSKQYGDNNNIKINDVLYLGQEHGLQLEVKGYAAQYSNIYPDLVSITTLANGAGNVNLKNGALLYTNDENYNLIKTKSSTGTEKNTGYININGDVTVAERNKILSDILDNYFVSPDDAILNFEASFAGQVVMLTNTGFIINSSIAIACSVIILIIIGFFIKKDISQQKRQIGLLKSLGYRRVQLAFIFTFNIIFTTLIGCIIGWVCSIPLQIFFTSTNINSIGLPLSTFYFNPIILVIGTIIIPLIFTILSFGISFILLNRSALELLYGLKANNLNVRRKRIKKVRQYLHFGMPFNVHLSFTFALKSIGKWFMVLFVLAFASFLLIFQLDAGVMANQVVNDSFRYFKDDIKSYLIATYDQQDIAHEAKGTSYQWVGEDQRDDYFFEAKILNNNNSFEFPDPVQCLVDLNINRLATLQSCGDLLNIIGNQNGTMIDPNDYSSQIKAKVMGNKLLYPYLSSKTVKAIANYKIVENGNLVDGWTALIAILNDPVTQALLIAEGIKKSDIDVGISMMNLIKEIDNITNGQYPNIYLGPYMMFDKNYDYNYIYSSARWSPDDKINANNPVSSVGIVGLTNDEYERNQLFNYSSSILSASQAQKLIFNYQINSEPIDNDVKKPINEPIPAFLAKRVYQSMKVKPGDIFTINVRITNAIGYVPIAFKVMAPDDGDISSGNIYVNKNSLATVMNQWVTLTGKGIIFPVNGYYNTIASKENSLGSVLQPYRILSSFSLSGNYDFTMLDSSGKLNFTNGNDLRTNLKLLNGFGRIWPFDTMRETYSQGMRTVSDILIMLEILTIAIVALILAVLISMVLDENRRTILTLKVLGYSTLKIVLIVLGFYLLAVVIGYVLSYVLAQGLWAVILNILFTKSGMLLTLSLSFEVVLIATLVIGAIMAMALIIGILRIKKNKLTNITLD